MNLTARDYYERTPEGPPWFELIEGTLVQEPSPRDAHQAALGGLYLALGAYLAAHPIGVIRLAPFDVYLDNFNVFQPDLLLLLKQRASRRTERGVKGAPDLVIEILSPSNRANDLGVKKRVYARSGVREIWIVDPVAKTVTAWQFTRSGQGRSTLWDNIPDARAVTPLLPGFSLPVRDIFSAP